MRLSLIVAMASNRVIGRDNTLPWHLPGDLPRFKRITMGHPIIMGRRNYESISRVLPGRANIIITRQRDYHVAGATVCYSFDDALTHCAGDDEAFVIGGAEIYRLALPRVERMYMTLIHQPVEGDVLFPEYDEAAFVEVEREDVAEPIAHSYVVFDRA
jgi:dihydrofolate reductase